VAGSSVNPVDWKISTAESQMMPLNMSYPLGFDCSGVVTAVGPGVTSLKVGDAVWADVVERTPNGLKLGAYAEYVVTKENKVALKPTTLSYEEAAVLPLVGLTALQGLRDGKIGAGSSVLILGGSSAVGICAIQIAKFLGAATVYATCSGKNTDFVKGLGADEVIDYSQHDWSTVLKGKNIDGAFDTVGEKDAATRAVEVLKDAGTITTIAGAAPKDLPRGITANFILTNSNSVDDLNSLKKMVEEEKLALKVAQTFPLTGVADAFKVSMEGRTVGKLSIKVK